MPLPKMGKSQQSGSAAEFWFHVRRWSGFSTAPLNDRWLVARDLLRKCASQIWLECWSSARSEIERTGTKKKAPVRAGAERKLSTIRKFEYDIKFLSSQACL